jgi:hypothetical protein
VSILSNSERSDEEEDEVPPDAELGLEDELELGLDVDDEVPPAADDGEDDLLPCDMEGDELEPLELFDESAA